MPKNDDLALCIAKALLIEFDIGNFSSFCEETDFDSASEEEVTAIIRKLLPAESDNRDALINSILLKPFPSISFAVKMTDIGLAYFCGNQWNEEWAWSRNGLNGLSDDALERLDNTLTTLNER